jgi:hypothetical protein
MSEDGWSDPVSIDSAPRSGYAPPTALTEARNISSESDMTMDEKVTVSARAKPKLSASSIQVNGTKLALETTKSAAKKLADSRSRFN